MECMVPKKCSKNLQYSDAPVSQTCTFTMGSGSGWAVQWAKDIYSQTPHAAPSLPQWRPRKSVLPLPELVSLLLDVAKGLSMPTIFEALLSSTSVSKKLEHQLRNELCGRRQSSKLSDWRPLEKNFGLVTKKC